MNDDTKRSIITGSYNYIDTFHAADSQEEQFVMLVKLCNKHPEFHTDSMQGEMAISKEDAISLAMYVVEAKIYLTRGSDPSCEENIALAMPMLRKYYPNYFIQPTITGKVEQQSAEEPEELFIPEKEENTVPSGIDPSSVIDMEEEVGSTEANMDGIPTFKPISIPLDDDVPQQPIDPSNPALAYFRGIPYIAPLVQQAPIHKVDNPPQVPVAPPVNTDPVDVNLGLISMSGMVQPQVQTQKPEFINPNLPKPAPEQNQSTGEVKNSVDNSVMIKKFPKLSLDHIEHLANINGCSVFFEEYPADGIVSVTTLDSEDKVIPWKSFCIDSGRIIDPRVKLIGGNPKFDVNSIIERLPFYELNSGRNGAKVLDTRMLEDIFKAGLENISKKKMYQKGWQDLNLKIALITLPTSFLNREERKSLQDYIMKMDKDGYFDKAISMSPGCRFVFFTKRLDKEHIGRFTLINEGVPMYYGGPVPENLVPIIIESNDGKIDIRTNGNADPNALPAIRYEQ